MVSRLVVVILVAVMALSCSGISFPVVKVENQFKGVVDGKETVRIAQGTGFFVSRGGIVVTAAHVVRGYHKTYIYHQGRKVSRRVRVLLADHDADFAILQVSGVRVDNPLRFCEDVKEGDSVSSWGWRGHGTEVTRGAMLGSVYAGVWVARVMVGPGFSGGPSYIKARKCVAGVTIRSNMDAREPLAVMVRPEASAKGLALLRKLAPDSVRGI